MPKHRERSVTLLTHLAPKDRGLSEAEKARAFRAACLLNAMKRCPTCGEYRAASTFRGYGDTACYVCRMAA